MKRPITIREEANAITCWAFRNGYLEELRAGKYSELLETPGLSQLTDTQIKRLMTETSATVAEILEMKETDPTEYWKHILYFHENFCQNWEK